MGIVRIGTSGWHYKHWKTEFYPAGTPSSRMLEYYCSRFDTVELNNSFYHLPSDSSLQVWRDNTPERFLFAVKGSRFLTHMKKLKDPELGLQRFLERAEILEQKLGPILFQLPPQFDFDEERLAHFLNVLPRSRRFAFEFRNPGWNNPAVYALLKQHKAGYCIFDLGGTHSPVEITSDFAYVRLHGPCQKYQGSYDDDALRAWAAQIKAWRRSLNAVYVYFDNDQEAFAAHNALRLKQFVLENETG